LATSEPVVVYWEPSFFRAHPTVLGHDPARRVTLKLGTRPSRATTRTPARTMAC